MTSPKRDIALNSKLDGTIPVAYLNIRGAAIAVVFPDAAFDSRSPKERSETYAALQAAAARDGFSGNVAAVWEDAQGRTKFIASAPQHPFFQVVNYSQLRAQVNGSIHL
jgi:hypothetical protein